MFSTGHHGHQVGPPNFGDRRATTDIPAIIRHHKASALTEQHLGVLFADSQVGEHHAVGSTAAESERYVS